MNLRQLTARPFATLPVALLLSAGTFLLYAGTVGAGFATDFTGLLDRMEGAPFRDFLNCFGFPAMHQVTNFFLYLFVKGFGLEALPWHLVFTGLHAANSLLAFLLARQLFEKNGLKNAAPAALMAALLFMSSPYQAEAVVWKVCLNFLSCTLLVQLSLWLAGCHLDNGRLRSLAGSHLAFLAALFTFELALALPLLSATWALMLSLSEGRVPAKHIAGRLLLPQLALVLIYFLLNKLLLGGWVGHYGEAVHLRFHPLEVSSNLMKYAAKYLFFWREMPHDWRQALMSWLEQPGVAAGGLSLAALLPTLFAFYFKKINTALRTAAWGWILFVLALLPVCNLSVAWLLQGENDRYGYLAAMFFFTGLAALLQLLPRWLRLACFLGWLGTSVYFLQKVNTAWQDSARLLHSLLEDFRWTEAPEVYVLAFPENYQGLPLFRDFSGQDLALKHTLKYLAGKPAKGRFFQISPYNVNSAAEGVQVSAAEAGVFQLALSQWGTWWWRNGDGTGDYETTRWRFQVEGNGCRVSLKQAPARGAVFIYATGGKWLEIALKETEYPLPTPAPRRSPPG